MPATDPRGLSEPDRVGRRTSFDTDADRYARSRPSYPDALFDRLAAYAGLSAGARVLEIAPGTGQATRSLATRGWTVTAVELGEQMAAVARRELADLPGVDIHVAAFEDWPLPAEPYDAVVCATAFHWLDPAVRLLKTAAALRPGGALAVVWTHHVAGGTPGFLERSQDCYDRFDPSPTNAAPGPEEKLVPSTRELDDSPLFTDVEDHRFRLEVSCTAPAYQDLLRTYSSTAALPPPQREGLVACLGDLVDVRFGGEVVMPYVFELVLARRAPAGPPR